MTQNQLATAVEFLHERIAMKPDEQEYERRRLIKQLQKRDLEVKKLKAERAELKAKLPPPPPDPAA
jgi:hypothetical protein